MSRGFDVLDLIRTSTITDILVIFLKFLSQPSQLLIEVIIIMSRVIYPLIYER